MVPADSGGPAQDAGRLLEVLDRVLDRGIVIDAEVTLSVAGLALAGIEVRIVVAAIETYLEYADELGGIAPASWRAESDFDGQGPALSDGLDGDAAHRLRPYLREMDDLP